MIRRKSCNQSTQKFLKFSISTVTIFFLSLVIASLLVSCGSQPSSVTFIHVASSAAPRLGVVIDKNMQVLGVDVGSAAEKAGIKPGDKLKKIDGAEVSSTEDAKQKVRDKAKKEKTDDRKVSILLSRNNQDLALDITLTPPSGQAGQSTVTPVPSNLDYF